ncbi:MAG: fimbrillin family protein [Marinifilaceae bacterium]
MKKIGKLLSKTLLVIAVAGLAYNCSKDDININVGSGQDKNCSGQCGSDTCSNSTSKKKLLLHFDAQVYDILTRAASSTPIGTNRTATIYAYNGTTRVQSSNYKSETTGTLSPVNAADSIALATGTYTLYVPGVNFPINTTVPTFSGTSVTGLQNNTDYIWANKSNLIVADKSQNVTLTFEHCCTQVLIILEDPDNVITGTPSIFLSPSSVTGNTWNLINGVISPSTSVQTDLSTLSVLPKTVSNIKSYYGQLIMMPLQATGDIMTVKLSATIQGAQADFSASLTPDGGYLQAGKSYAYYLKVSVSGITFTNSVNIENWIPVDVNSGAPIIPSQI